MSDYRNPSEHNPKESQCTGKVAFASYYAAERVAKQRHRTSVKKRGRTHAPRAVYHCPYCHQYHIARYD